MTFCPAYWEWLDLQYNQKQLGSITSVYEELANYGDELSAWVKERKEQFISVSDEQTQQKYAEIAQYVYDLENKNPIKVDNFLNKADPWLIAKAHILDATVVTQERLVDDNCKDVKIPNVCRDFDVNYTSTFQLLSDLEARFILQV